VQSINFFALFVLQAMIKSKWRTTFLIAPTVLHVWLISFLGLSAQALVFLRLRRAISIPNPPYLRAILG